MTSSLAVVNLFVAGLGLLLSSQSRILVIRLCGYVWFGASAAMFGLRPLLTMGSGDLTYLTIDISETYFGAVAAGTIGIMTSLVGWFVALHRPGSQRTAVVSLQWTTGGLRSPAMLLARRCLIVALVALGVLLVQAHTLGALGVLLTGRSTERNALALSSSGYLYEAFLLGVPAAVLTLSNHDFLDRRLRWRRRRALVLGIALVVVGAIVAGGRFYVILLLLALAYCYNARRRGMGRRLGPHTLLMVLALAPALLWLTVGLREARTANDATGYIDTLTPRFWADKGGEAFARTVLGPDLEMVDFLAATRQVIPSERDYFRVGTLTDVAVRSVPRPLWPSKPQETSQQAVDTVLPGRTSLTRAASASSIYGSLYIDNGFPGVAVGSFLFGFLIPAAGRRLSLPTVRPEIALVCSAALPGVVLVLVRGTLAHAASTAFFLMVAPALLIRVPRLRWRSATAPRSITNASMT